MGKDIPDQRDEAETNLNSDPFNRVLLGKGIDNALLTSYRTLSKKNNTIS
jgi:hypothetical protein